MKKERTGRGPMRSFPFHLHYCRSQPIEGRHIPQDAEGDRKGQHDAHERVARPPQPLSDRRMISQEQGEKDERQGIVSERLIRIQLEQGQRRSRHAAARTIMSGHFVKDARNADVRRGQPYLQIKQSADGKRGTPSQLGVPLRIRSEIRQPSC